MKRPPGVTIIAVLILPYGFLGMALGLFVLVGLVLIIDNLREVWA